MLGSALGYSVLTRDLTEMKATHAPAQSADAEQRVASALTRRYAIALVLVALLSTAAWVSLGLVIAAQESSAALVNISGRQRMLSQRTALFAAQLATARSAEIHAVERRLQEAVQLMADSHRGLTQGNARLGLPTTQSARVHSLYFDAPMRLDQQVREHVAHIEQWLALPAAQRRMGHPMLEAILHPATGPLLADLDAMVAQYQAEGEAAVAQLHRIETGLWLATLVLLGLEALFIFQPFVRHVRTVVGRLATSRQSLQVERDRLERAVAERTASLQTQVNRLQVHETTLEQIPQGVLFCAPDHRIVYANPGFEQTTGYSRHEVMGRTCALLEGPETDPATATNIQHALREQQAFRGTVLHYTRDGRAFWNDLSLRPVHGDMGVLLGYAAVLHDVSELKYRESNYWAKAHHDPLTGLPNRLLLAERWQQAVLRCVRYRFHGALLFIDLDRFKAVNDQWGHDCGDAVLVEVGHRLSAQVRDIDTTVRLGGDEFVVLLTDLHTDPVLAQQQAETVARKLEEAVSTPYNLNTSGENGGAPVFWRELGASIGLALFNGQDTQLEPVIQAADQSMYRQKSHRRHGDNGPFPNNPQQESA